MLEKIRSFDDNVLTIEIIDGYTETLVPIDNLFFERVKEGREERYFDVSQMDEALAFMTNNKKDPG